MLPQKLFKISFMAITFDHATNGLCALERGHRWPGSKYASLLRRVRDLHA